MNKRGDISIILLVIGVFAVCTLAIVSFIFHINLKPENFANIEIVENLSSNIEDFYFYINSGLSQSEAAEKIGAQIQGNRLILTAEQKEYSGFITKKEIKTVLSAQYIIDLSG